MHKAAEVREYRIDVWGQDNGGGGHLPLGQWPWIISKKGLSRNV